MAEQLSRRGGLTSRLLTWRATLWRPVFKAIGAVLGLVGTVQTILGLASAQTQERAKEFAFLLDWPWYIWVIALLATALACSLEGTYRVIAAKEQELAATVAEKGQVIRAFQERLAEARGVQAEIVPDYTFASFTDYKREAEGIAYRCLRSHFGLRFKNHDSETTLTQVGASLWLTQSRQAHDVAVVGWRLYDSTPEQGSPGGSLKIKLPGRFVTGINYLEISWLYSLGEYEEIFRNMETAFVRISVSSLGNADHWLDVPLAKIIDRRLIDTDGAVQ